ncbi:MAG TPA: hypothetical protein V6D12_14185 [Candidatus Obscuribacterales bacterium]
MRRIKNLLFALTLAALSATNALSQEALLKVRINDFSGGMVSNSLADVIAPNQGASMVNVELNRPGRLSKRKGQALFARDVGSTPFVGIGRFDPDRTTSYLVAASGTRVVRALSSSADWTVANPSNALTAGQNTEFVQANDLLFILNGFDSTAWYSGSHWSTAGAYPTSPPTARTGAWLRNYLFLAGATTETDWVYFSNNLDPDTFSSGDIIKINTGDGQSIQKVVPFRLNELIIYKERSVFVLDITGSTPLSDWTVQPVSTVVGTIAPRSVVSLGNDQWFLSSEPIAIRSLVRSEFDKILLNLVSGPIQDVFDGTGILTINKTHISKAAATLFNNKYFLAVPTGTSTVNNTVFVYDFITNGWYRIDGWFPADWVVFDNRLFYIDANDGRVIECFSGTAGDWPQGPGTIDSASTPSVGIAFNYITKNIDFDYPENFKQLDSLEVEFDATGDYNAEVFVNLDSDGWQRVGTVNLAGNSLTLPVTLPATLGNGGLARKTFQLTQYGEFKKMQVMVQQWASSTNVTLQRITIFSRLKPWRRE